MANSDGSSILWFLAGVGIGTAVGILYAPRSGSETREVFGPRLTKDATSFAPKHRKPVNMRANGWIRDAM